MKPILARAAKRMLPLLVCCVLLTACKAGDSPPDFSAAEFDAEILLSTGGKEYAASYSQCGTLRTLQFSAPETLRGLCAEQQTGSGAVTLTLGDLSFAADAAEGIFDFTGLFAPPPDCLRLCKTEDGILCYVGENGSDSYMLYTDDAGLLLRLCGSIGGREYDIQVLRFSVRNTGGEELR